MFSSFSNSWQLVKSSWSVLQQDRELLWFPVLSGIVSILITLSFFIPGAVIVTGSSFVLGEDTFNVVAFVAGFVWYMISYTVVIYFNTALIAAAMMRLGGRDPGLNDGFRIANQRLPQILGYAAISATVGMILRAIEERAGFVGDIIVGIIGVVWNVATFLVIPVLVVEDVGPIDAVKKSASMLRDTWGEQITGNVSIGGIFFLLYLALFIVGGGIVFALASMTESTIVIIGGIIVLVIAAIMLGVISAALNGIFQAALYRYARTGDATGPFDSSLMDDAFKQKKKKRGLL